MENQSTNQQIQEFIHFVILDEQVGVTKKGKRNIEVVAKTSEGKGSFPIRFPNQKARDGSFDTFDMEDAKMFLEKYKASKEAE